MNNKLTITIEPEDPELNRQMELFQRNARWMSDHCAPYYDLYRGKHVAASEGEIFVAEGYLEAERLALEKHPDDAPYIRYIPREKYFRIYAG